MRTGIVFLLLGAGGVALAQQPVGEPEVRRAIPVYPTTPGEPEIRRAIPVERSTPPPAPPTSGPYTNPSWMERVQPTPAPTPVPPPPGPEPGFTPYRPTGRVEVAPLPTATPLPTPTSPAPGLPVAPTAPPTNTAPTSVPTPDADGVIRLSPTNSTAISGAAADLDRANTLFARKMYDYAVADYERFLISYPSAPGRDQALFRLGESHRLLDNETSARDAYARLLKETKTGEYAGAAAFRLGEYLFAAQLYDPALIQFRIAESQSTLGEVRLSATYQQARILEKMGQSAEAIKKYEAVAGVAKDNPFRNYARLSLASLSAAAGDKKGALEVLIQLANDQSSQAPIRAEAAVKAGAVASEMGNNKQAAELFTKSLSLSDTGDWKPIAILGALRANYSLGNYAKVTEMADKYTPELPEGTRAEAMLLSANAYRQQGNARAARAVYDRLITQYPEANQAQDARFQKLLSMYQLDDPLLLTEVDEFLKTNTDPKIRAQVSLLKAETLFKKQKYAEALPLYSQIATSNLDEDIKGKAMMKLGWCLAKTGQSSAAADAFSGYLTKYPKGASVIPAFIQRGLAKQELKEYAAALEDFETVIAKFPESKERELALQQKALILGQQKDNKRMVETFRQLLKEYPKSEGAAQANFWIGWAAYEDKDYKGAIDNLEAARKLDPDQYGDRAGLRVLLCYYYLEDRDAVKRLMETNKKLEAPSEILKWLGRKSFAEKDYAGAAKYLKAALKDGKTNDPDVYIELAEALIQQGKPAEAASPAANYLEGAREPYTRARALLAQGNIALAERCFDEATKHAEESLLLQPEGKLNAQGRLLFGEIDYAKGSYSEAAKAFMTIAVLYDDPLVTPLALERSADAYNKAGDAFNADKAEKELQQRFPDYKKSSKVPKG